MIAKLNVYGIDNENVRFFCHYLTFRKQRTKTYGTCSSCQEILSGVNQGSILGPLLFNIDVCNLFFITKDYNIANYADNNTPYLSSKNVEEVFLNCVNL